MKIQYEEKSLKQSKLLIGRNRITIRIPNTVPERAKGILKQMLCIVALKHVDKAPAKASYKVGTPFIFLKSSLTGQTVAVERII